MREQGFFWQFKTGRLIEYQVHDGILLVAAIRMMKRFDKQKEPAALRVTQKPPVQNGRADMSAIRRLFSFAVVRQLANRLFLFMRIIIKSKCYTNVRGAFDFDRKTGWIVTKLGHFKNFFEKWRKKRGSTRRPADPIRLFQRPDLLNKRLLFQISSCVRNQGELHNQQDC